MPRSALLVIDIQNDFCDGGALAVPGAEEIIPSVNDLATHFETVIFSQDWHPANHSSFASNTKAGNPYDIIEMPYGDQVLWPDHCVQGSKGAEFHHDLETSVAQAIIRKGFRPEVDSYSAFFENDQATPTGLHGLLRSRDIDTVSLVGLAYDFCVQFTALDAVRLGFSVQVHSQMTRSIDLDGSKAAATQKMRDANVEIL